MRRVYSLKTFILLFILSGVYVFIFSDSGIMERMSLHKKSLKLLGRINDLKAENRKLGDLYRFYKDGGLTESDVLKSGFVRRGDKVVFFRGLDPEKNTRREKVEPGNGFFLSSKRNLRITWLIISALTITIYLYRNAGNTEAE